MTQVVDVFIASPNDVQEERGYAEEAIRQISARIRDVLNMVLHPVSWQNFLPVAAKNDGDRPQDFFSLKVRKCGIFIGILYQRYGTETDGIRKISGTEEEFQVAIENRLNVEILTYFRKQEATVRNRSDDLNQAARLQSLQTEAKTG
jgi:hypothetical protein